MYELSRPSDGQPRPVGAATVSALSVEVAVTASVYAASAIGLIDLIAKGYGALTWAFIALLIVPVLTVGIWRIRQLTAAGVTTRR